MTEGGTTGGIRRNHSGSDRGKSQDGVRREQDEPGGTQNPARMAAHSEADGGRSHGGGKADDSRGMIDGGLAGGRGAQDKEGEPRSQGDGEDPEGQGGAVGSGDQGIDEDPEGRGGAK